MLIIIMTVMVVVLMMIITVSYAQEERFSQKQVDDVIRLTNRPHRLLVTVMTATLTLLGHTERQVKVS